jgi:serine protease Do
LGFWTFGKWGKQRVSARKAAVSYNPAVQYFLRVFRCVLAVSLLVLAACASGPQTQLGRGACPAYIVFPGERSEAGRARYGENISDAQLALYRDQEKTNCNTLLAAGDARALDVLLEYGYAQSDTDLVLASYRAYLDAGNDSLQLAEASASLYKFYANGEAGVAPDPDAAFHYLSMAAEHDPATYELRYADAQYERGLYADAHTRYSAFLVPGPKGDYLGVSSRCEINLKMADLYFRGRGVSENWYIGYYYWLEGMSMARDAAWGSCDNHTYYDHDRYAYESARRKAVERRKTAMGSWNVARIENAWSSSDEGLDYISSLDFRRPVLRESASRQSIAATGSGRALRPPLQSSASLSAGAGVSWPAWRPVDAQLCQRPASYVPGRWSDVFQQRSGAIWSVKTSSDGTRSMGSAVAVSSTLLVTNCHFIKDSSRITLLRTGIAMGASLIAADREGDRCILSAANNLPVYVNAARRYADVLVGEDVAAIGNPRGLDTSLSRGIVAQKRGHDGRRLIQTDAAISSGSSGGGLFDTSANLVGITTFKVSSGESLNFAIAIDEFCR